MKTEVLVRKASGREFQIVGAEKEKDVLLKLDFILELRLNAIQ